MSRPQHTIKREILNDLLARYTILSSRYIKCPFCFKNLDEFEFMKHYNNFHKVK